MFVEGDRIRYVGPMEMWKGSTGTVRGMGEHGEHVLVTEHVNRSEPSSVKLVPVEQAKPYERGMSIWVPGTERGGPPKEFVQRTTGGRSTSFNRKSLWPMQDVELVQLWPYTDPGDPKQTPPKAVKHSGLLKKWQRRSFLCAQSKGFHDGADHLDPVRISSRLMLITGELAEAEEECCRGHMDLWFGENAKPSGFGIELADVFLRLVDLAETTGVDLEDMVRLKYAYNVTRPLRHGGKKL